MVGKYRSGEFKNAMHLKSEMMFCRVAYEAAKQLVTRDGCTPHICATVWGFLSLLLSLFQQDFLGLVQAELQGVEFAGVFLNRADVLPQLPAALLPAQARGGRVSAAAVFQRLLSVTVRVPGAQDRLQHLEVLTEKMI